MNMEDNRTSTARWTWLRPGRHPGWLWPVAVLLGFPIGGFIADLVVDGVDSVGTALAAGLIAGAIIGAAEWFALRNWVSWLWIPATTAGNGCGLGCGSGSGRLRDRSRRRCPHGCRDWPRCRGGAGARARARPDQRRVLVGNRDPARLGAWLARNLLRDHDERQGAICGLRRQRSARLRTADLAPPCVPPRTAGTRFPASAGCSGSLISARSLSIALSATGSSSGTATKETRVAGEASRISATGASLTTNENRRRCPTHWQPKRPSPPAASPER